MMKERQPNISVVRVFPIDATLPREGYLDLTDAARYVGVARSTMQRWLDTGRVSAVRDEPWGGRAGWRWLIPTRDLAPLRRRQPVA